VINAEHPHKSGTGVIYIKHHIHRL